MLRNIFYTGQIFWITMSEIEDVVKKFNEADNAIRTLFPKSDPILVVNLIFDEKAGRNNIYTLEVNLKAGQNLEEMRDRVVQLTGMVPSFYLHGTQMIVSHHLNLEMLKRINDVDAVVKIKGSPYSAGGSSDF
ncbi:MAG TPA: hypothetical protein VF884_14070 [Nitrososphaeraceae archaeon]